MHHSVCLPHAYVRVFCKEDTDLDYSQRFLRSLAKKLAQVDVAARQFQQGEEKKLVNELTASLGTFDWVLTREILVEGEQASWNLRSPQMRAHAWSIFASSAETKSSCENPFGWLRGARRMLSPTPPR